MCAVCSWELQLYELAYACRLLNNPEQVDIRCVECILDGSPGVKQLRLNDRVEFDVHTVFKAQQGGDQGTLSALFASDLDAQSKRQHCPNGI